MLPCGYPPPSHERASQHLIAAAFPDARARARLPGSRDDYELPFSAPKRPSRLLWVLKRETARFRWPHPLRSLDPPASPFTPDQVALDRRSILFWASRPSEAFSLHASDSQPRAHPKDSKPLRATRRCRLATRRATPPTLARGLPVSDLASACPPWPEGFRPTARDSSSRPRPEGRRSALETPRHEHRLDLTTRTASQARGPARRSSSRSSLARARELKLNLRQPSPAVTETRGPRLGPSPAGSNPRSSPKALTQLLTRGSSARLQGTLGPWSQVRPLQTEA